MHSLPRAYWNTPAMTAQTPSYGQRRRSMQYPSNDQTRNANISSSNDRRQPTLPSPPPLSRAHAHTRQRSSSDTSTASTLVGSEQTHNKSGLRRSRQGSFDSTRRYSIAKPSLSVVKESRLSDVAEIAAPPIHLTMMHQQLPSYAEAQANPEPRTVPMFLFFLGFLCPLLWIVGTFMMRLPHKERRGALDPSAMAGLPVVEKAAAEREVARMRRKWEAEMKWGKRCMWAAVLFVCLGLAAGVTTWGAITARKPKIVVNF